MVSWPEHALQRWKTLSVSAGGKAKKRRQKSDGEPRPENLSVVLLSSRHTSHCRASQKDRWVCPTKASQVAESPGALPSV